MEIVSLFHTVFLRFLSTALDDCTTEQFISWRVFGLWQGKCRREPYWQKGEFISHLVILWNGGNSRYWGAKSKSMQQRSHIRTFGWQSIICGINDPWQEQQPLTGWQEGGGEREENVFWVVCLWYDSYGTVRNTNGRPIG